MHNNLLIIFEKKIANKFFSTSSSKLFLFLYQKITCLVSKIFVKFSTIQKEKLEKHVYTLVFLVIMHIRYRNLTKTQKNFEKWFFTSQPRKSSGISYMKIYSEYACENNHNIKDCKMNLNYSLIILRAKRKNWRRILQRNYCIKNSPNVIESQLIPWNKYLENNVKLKSIIKRIIFFLLMIQNSMLMTQNKVSTLINTSKSFLKNSLNASFTRIKLRSRRYWIS